MLTKTSILIRPIQLSDADAIVRLANNDKVLINLRCEFPSPYLIEHANDFINKSLNDEENLHFAIEFEGLFAGIIALQIQSDGLLKSAEVGYWLGEPFWGKGIATKVLHSIISLGFSKLRLNKLFAGVLEWNKAGMRVLEKCGFQLEGISYNDVHKNGQIVDEYWYGLSAI